MVKNLPANAGDTGDVGSLGWEVPLKKEMATHSSIIAWEIPWTKKPGELKSLGLQRVRHDLTIKTTTTDISLHICTTFSLSVPLLMDI